jgi:hypothetical protein
MTWEELCMTHRQIREHFPNASNSFIKANLSGSESERGIAEHTHSADALGPMPTEQVNSTEPEAIYENRSQIPSTEPEQTVCDEPLAKSKRKKGYALRSVVRIISYRRRLLDTDNLCVKSAVDSLRYAGVISNDDPDTICLQVEQRRVKSKADERTVIEIWP